MDGGHAASDLPDPIEVMKLAADMENAGMGFTLRTLREEFRLPMETDDATLASQFISRRGSRRLLLKAHLATVLTRGNTWEVAI